jgi:hypothetical protein
MLKLRSLKIQIDKLLVFLLENKLAIDSNSAIVRKFGHNSILTWANAPDNLFSPSFGQYSTITEYRHFIQNRYYHCILFDGSIIQFGYSFNNNSLVKHRNCYYPCPINITSTDFDNIQPGDDFVTLFDLLLDNELDAFKIGTFKPEFSNLQHLFKLSSPFRFDYDPEAQTNTHPASHLHLVSEDCRWPIYGPISVGHFVRFVFRHFYPSLWHKFEILRSWPLGFDTRSISDQEQCEFHIECHEHS